MESTSLIALAERLADLLDAAERTGNTKDEPEGSRVVILSDTLAKEWAQALRDAAAAQKRVRFIPRGSDQPLPEVPGAEVITEAEVNKAVREWDRKVPERFVGQV